MNIKTVSKEFKDEMKSLYGDMLYKVILFGSFARNDFRDDSDVDFLVVLNKDGSSSLDRNIKNFPCIGGIFKPLP